MVKASKAKSGKVPKKRPSVSLGKQSIYLEYYEVELLPLSLHGFLSCCRL